MGRLYRNWVISEWLDFGPQADSYNCSFYVVGAMRELYGMDTSDIRKVRFTHFIVVAHLQSSLKTGRRGS